MKTISITPFQDNTVLGTYQATLPTAREFVKFSGPVQARATTGQKPTSAKPAAAAGPGRW